MEVQAIGGADAGDIVSDPAVKQRLRRAKARASAKLQGRGWAVVPLACANCHILAQKGRKTRAIRIEFIDSPDNFKIGVPPIGVSTFEVWRIGKGKGEFIVSSVDMKTGIKRTSKIL